MSHQPELIPDQPSPEQAARDAERAEYLERLREKLKDLDFRAIEGFPHGRDEDILALSDPPYYTACPNPFLPEIIERWQAERAQLRAELSLPDDSDDNGDSGEPVYHREPFAADVSEGKYDPIYRAHSYHTKVPHKAAMRYILHYTDPGDIVFDGFCGTGMTGVAAQLCGDKKEVESLGYRVRKDDTVLDEQDHAVSRLGARKPVLVDLSPIATFIACNYNIPTDVAAFEREAKRVLREVEMGYGWIYETDHTGGRVKGKINYTVFSEIFICPNCSGEVSYWKYGVDLENSVSKSRFPCPHCGVTLHRRNLERSKEVVWDPLLGKSVTRARSVPVLIDYSIGGQRYQKPPDRSDIAVLERIGDVLSKEALLVQELPYMHMTHERNNLAQSHGITHVHHFFTQRNYLFLSALWRQALQSLCPRSVLSVLTSFMDNHSSRRNRYLVDKHHPKGTPGGPLTNTLYLAPLQSEVSIANIWRKTFRKLSKTAQARQFYSQAIISTASATDINVSKDSVDYIFTDPPFGGNIPYSDLNFIPESWLGIHTNTEAEAIENPAESKGLLEYGRLMQASFAECFRILKPGRWMTVVFHNSRNAVWNTIQEAISASGFVVADVRTLEKGKGTTIHQDNKPSAAKQDLVISSYKPRSGFERRFLEQAGSAEGAWDFVRQHLEQLPVVVEQDGTLEVVAERQAYLLYDRMVAFHIQRGFSVPLGAAEFYAGLKQRFPERDGMYFLSHQVAEYERRRMQVSQVEQLALFVTDEKSAIQWLRRELDPTTGSGLQTYQDLQPKFLRELHQARHEALPELSDVLTQNFLKDEQDRWYVPDPARQEDLEKLRERSLLREFQEYAQGKGRLRVFRTEAVRAGFKHAWHERDYRLIVKVAERLPASVLQEDASLLMYYDNALMRAESEPEQGQLL